MFSDPLYLFLLWLIPLFAGFYWYAFRKNRQITATWFAPSMLRQLVPAVSLRRYIAGVVLILAGLMLGIIAVAGPQFGYEDELVTFTGADVFILLDVSKSMLAEDVTPNRLERAKSDIRDVLQQVAGNRVGLIVFAGKPIVKVPLTTDEKFFLDVLRSIDTGSAPRGGTAIGDALRLAMAAMPQDAARQQAIVLITDGDDQESMPLEAAKAAAKANIPILTVSIGDTKEGGRIPIRDGSGRLTYMQYNGQEVWTKANDRQLQEIAQITGGAFLAAGEKAYNLGSIYAGSIGKLKGSGSENETRRKLQQQFQWFLLGAVVLLLIKSGM